MRRLFPVALTVAAACCSAAAWAHFPFLHLKSDGGSPSLHVYFAESAEPDDPALLDRLAGAQVWQVRADGASEPLKVSKGESSLTTPVTTGGPTVYAFYKDYGTLSRNGETFRLAYYAKTFSGPEAWAIEPGEKSKLDIVPKQDAENLTLTVTWDGKPVSGAEVAVQGGLDFEEGKTGEDGRFTCKATGTDLYSIRAKHVEATPGERDGKKYDAVRHYATLSLDIK